MQANEIILLKLTLAYAKVQCLDEQRKRIEAYLAIAKKRLTPELYEVVASYINLIFKEYQETRLANECNNITDAILFSAKAWLLRREAITSKDFDKLFAQEKELKLQLTDYVPYQLIDAVRSYKGKVIRIENVRF